MRLYYHKDPFGNFGDDLNPWLWRRLLPNVFDGVCYHAPGLREPGSDQHSLFVGIGTLLNQHIPSAPKKAIFSTGTGYGNSPNLDSKWRIYCVRGPRTAYKLGLSNDYAITDGAALASTIEMEYAARRIPVAFMPHVSTARNGYWKQVCDSLKIHYLDPQGSVNEVFRQLLATDLLIAEAMHGAILADALRIPWIPVTTKQSILKFKWLDWCESLSMKYNPHQMISLWGSIKETTWPKKTIKLVKYQMAKQSLKKIAAQGKPMLSDNRIFASRVEELQNRLYQFQQDLKKGEYEK